MEKFGQYFNLKEKILIYEKKKEFKFTMFKIKDISIFALIKNNDIIKTILLWKIDLI